MLNLIVFISPVLLLIIVGILIRARGNPETAGRRYFLFLVWTSIGALALILLNWTFPRLLFGYGLILFPVIPGLVVLTLLQWHEWNSLSRQAKIPILSVVILLIGLTVVQFAILNLKGDERQIEAIFFGMTLFTITAFLFLARKWGMHYPLLPSAITALYLIFFLAFDLGSVSLPSETMPGWWNVSGALAYLAIPGITIPVMAMLTAGALNIASTTGEAKPVAWIPLLGRLALVIVLFGLFFYVNRWFWLWDGMDDGIRWIMTMIVSAITALSAWLVIAMTASGWRRWIGLVFVGLIVGPLYLAGMAQFGFGNEVTNYTVTEERAARIQQAVENHRVKTGWYPLKLEELVPGEMWRIPLPMIVPGQGWCYQGGSNYYRLGAVYREHWSSPYFSVRVYASAGNVPEGTWECDEKLAEAKSQSPYLDPPPTPVPLPASEVSVPRVVVEPLLQASSFSVGSWSPDGKYLVFGFTSISWTKWNT